MANPKVALYGILTSFHFIRAHIVAKKLPSQCCAVPPYPIVDGDLGWPKR